MNRERHFCNTCNGSTNHQILGEPILNSPESINWILFQCCGCEDVFLLKQIFSEIQGLSDEDAEEIEPQCERIPPKIEYHLPSWINEINELGNKEDEQEFIGQVDTSIKQLMGEIYVALNHSAFNLACTGLRTVLDCVFQDKVGDNLRTRASFDEKLGEMVTQGLISNDDKDKLAVIINVGHASAHRGLTPPPHILESALDITEHLLKSLYIHPNELEAIKNITPAIR